MTIENELIFAGLRNSEKMAFMMELIAISPRKMQKHYKTRKDKIYWEKLRPKKKYRANGWLSHYEERDGRIRYRSFSEGLKKFAKRENRRAIRRKNRIAVAEGWNEFANEEYVAKEPFKAVGSSMNKVYEYAYTLW